MKNTVEFDSLSGVGGAAFAEFAQTFFHNFGEERARLGNLRLDMECALSSLSQFIEDQGDCTPLEKFKQNKFKALADIGEAPLAACVQQFFVGSCERELTLHDLHGELEFALDELEGLIDEYGEDAFLKDFRYGELPDSDSF